MKALDFIIGLLVVFSIIAFIAGVADIKDERNAPCEYFKNRTLDRIPARCLEYYKK